MGSDCFIPMTHILTREFALTAILRGKMECYFCWMHFSPDWKQTCRVSTDPPRAIAGINTNAPAPTARRPISPAIGPGNDKPGVKSDDGKGVLRCRSWTLHKSAWLVCQNCCEADAPKGGRRKRNNKTGFAPGGGETPADESHSRTAEFSRRGVRPERSHRRRTVRYR